MIKLKHFTFGCLLLVSLSLGFGSAAQSIEPNKHPVKTACVATTSDGREITVGYANDCALGGDGCIDVSCTGAPASVN